MKLKLSLLLSYLKKQMGLSQVKGHNVCLEAAKLHKNYNNDHCLKCSFRKEYTTSDSIEISLCLLVKK